MYIYISRFSELNTQLLLLVIIDSQRLWRMFSTYVSTAKLKNI